LAGDSGNTVRGNKIANAGHQGILVEDDGSLIENNSVKGAGFGDDDDGNAFDVSGSGNTIRGNKVSTCGTTPSRSPGTETSSRTTRWVGPATAGSTSRASGTP
jgi:parallel beta-helix repeat protein